MNKVISDELIYKGKIIEVKKELLILPNNKQAVREFVHHSKAVAIIPIINDEIIFVKQYRTGTKDYMIELPAGLVEENEDPQQCAIRELQEEIGYEPTKLTYYGEYYLSPGFCDESIYLFLAEGLKYNPKKPDEDEFIEIIKLPLSKIKEFMKNNMSSSEHNTKLDAKTILGISLYLLNNQH